MRICETCHGSGRVEVPMKMANVYPDKHLLPKDKVPRVRACWACRGEGWKGNT